MSPVTSPPSTTALVDALQRVTRQVVGLTAQAISHGTEDGVTLLQYRALVVLARRRGTTAGELAGELGVSPPAVSRLVRTLSDRGLLVRREGDDDRRRVHLTLTQRGARLVEDVTRTRAREFREAISGFSPTERATLYASLRRFEEELAS